MFLLCAVKRNSPILRDSGKWIVSYDEIPGNVSVYPDYCQGSVYILTPRTAASIVEAAKHVKFLWIDDAWVTGYIRDYLNISIQVSQISIRFDVFFIFFTPQDFKLYWTGSSKVLLLHKAVQNVEMYQPDLLSGPTDRDLSLASAVDRKAAWCYVERCNNNLYYQGGAGKNDMGTFELLKKLLLK